MRDPEFERDRISRLHERRRRDAEERGPTHGKFCALEPFERMDPALFTEVVRPLSPGEARQWLASRKKKKEKKFR